MNEIINSYDTILKAQLGDDRALNDLVLNNIALVKSIAVKFINRGVEYEDLIQIGSIGLIRAISKFDTSFDVKFSTYAVPMIMGEIKRFMRDNGTVKVSRALKETAYKVVKASEDLKKKLGREPTVFEISKMLDIEENDIVVAMEAAKPIISLDEAMYEDNNKATLLESIEDTKEEVNSVVERIMLKQVLSNLPGRDRQIIIMRYFQDKTQSEVADSLNISQVQVSRLEHKILNSMKKSIL